MPFISASAHELKVRRIAASLASRPPQAKLSLLKKAVSHQVPKARDLRRRDHKVDVRDLDQILSIDPEARTCEAESGITFDALCTETLRYGLVPIVVPELKTITIGGAVSGCSLESMSFKYGGFHDTCLSYEIISAAGEIVKCSPTLEPLVFQMMQGSFGTLGVLTKMKFKLVPAKPFVHMTYERYTTVADYMAAIRAHAAADDLDFMDGMVHATNNFILSCGRFVDAAPYTHSYDWMRVYFRSTDTRKEDYLRTKDYFFRYDRGVTNVHPKSFLARLLFGRWLDSSRLLRLADKLHFLLPHERPDITLDVFIPLNRMPEFISWYAKEFAHFPLWCVPYGRVRDYEWLVPTFYDDMNDNMLVDLAIYGMKQTGDKHYHRLMEAKLRELGGLKTLISHNYYSHAEFWAIWNKDNYDIVKARLDPQNIFRDVYTKTCHTAMGSSAEPQAA